MNTSSALKPLALASAPSASAAFGVAPPPVGTDIGGACGTARRALRCVTMLALGVLAAAVFGGTMTVAAPAPTPTVKAFWSTTGTIRQVRFRISESYDGAGDVEGFRFALYAPGQYPNGAPAYSEEVLFPRAPDESVSVVAWPKGNQWFDLAPYFDSASKNPGTTSEQNWVIVHTSKGRKPKTTTVYDGVTKAVAIFVGVRVQSQTIICFFRPDPKAGWDKVIQPSMGAPHSWNVVHTGGMNAATMPVAQRAKVLGGVAIKQSRLHGEDLELELLKGDGENKKHLNTRIALAMGHARAYPMIFISNYVEADNKTITPVKVIIPGVYNEKGECIATYYDDAKVQNILLADPNQMPNKTEALFSLLDRYATPLEIRLPAGRTDVNRFGRIGQDGKGIGKEYPDGSKLVVPIRWWGGYNPNVNLYGGDAK